MTDEDKKKFPVVFNALRLLRDAVLLKGHERHASAYALAILALEEIGKVVLHLWRAPERNEHGSFHVRKQRAAASLLLGQFMVKELGQEAVDAPEITPELVGRAVKAAFESEHAQFARMVDLTAVDKTKQAAFYHDDWRERSGLHADQFSGSDVDFLLEKCCSAVRAVGDARMMSYGKTIFEQHPSNKDSRPPKPREAR